MFVKGEHTRRFRTTVAEGWGRMRVGGKRLLARLTTWMPGRHA